MSKQEYIGFRVTPEEKEILLRRFGSPNKMREFLLVPHIDVKELKGISTAIEKNIQLLLDLDLDELVKYKRKANYAKTKPRKQTYDRSLLVYPFPGEEFAKAWDTWLKYKKGEHRQSYKMPETEQAALDALARDSNNDEKTAIYLINYAREKRWKGIYVPLHDKAMSPKKVITAKAVAQMLRIAFKKEPTKFFLDSLRNSPLYNDIVRSEKAAQFCIDKLAHESGGDTSVAISILNQTLKVANSRKNQQIKSTIAPNKIGKAV